MPIDMNNMTTLAATITKPHEKRRANEPFFEGTTINTRPATTHKTGHSCHQTIP